jgi:hypothetical protein
LLVPVVFPVRCVGRRRGNFQFTHRNSLSPRRDIQFTHRNCIFTHRKTISTRVKTISTHRNFLFTHRDGKFTHRNFILTHRNFQFTHRDGKFTHRNFISPRVEIILTRRNFISTHRKIILIRREIVRRHHFISKTGQKRSKPRVLPFQPQLLRQMNTLEITFKPMADGLDWEMPDVRCVRTRSGPTHEAWR